MTTILSIIVIVLLSFGFGLLARTAAGRRVRDWLEYTIMGFVVEVHADGHRTVYVPGAPNPASGSIFYMTEDRIRPLDAKTPAVVTAIRHLGLGSKEILKGKLGERA
jgi:uncharacterized membrane protein